MAALHSAYPFIQSRVIVFLADTDQAFVRNIAKVFSYDRGQVKMESYEPKIVLLKPNHHSSDINLSKNGEKAEHIHEPLQKYKMDSLISSKNIK